MRLEIQIAYGRVDRKTAPTSGAPKSYIVWEIDNDDSDFPYNTIFMRPFLRINTTHQWHARIFDEIRREPSVHSRLSALWEYQ